MIDPNKKKKDNGLKVVQQLSNHNNEAIKSLIALVNSLSKRLEKVENRLGLQLSKSIKELELLPEEAQEFVLRSLSRKLEPLQIDDEIYMIPHEVNDLIDNLIAQIHELRIESMKALVGTKGN